jgi:hypothetical protein
MSFKVKSGMQYLFRTQDKFDTYSVIDFQAGINKEPIEETLNQLIIC